MDEKKEIAFYLIINNKNGQHDDIGLYVSLFIVEEIKRLKEREREEERLPVTYSSSQMDDANAI